MAADDAAEEETIVSHPMYRITRRRTEDFQILKVTGKYTDAMLDDFRSKIFLYKKKYGVDFSGLTGMNAALARELADTSETLRAGEKRLVLIGPPETLRSLLRMTKINIEIVLSEDKIRKPEENPRKPGGLESDESSVYRELERVRKD